MMGPATKIIWQVGPDGTAQELGKLFGIEIEEQSGGRTFSHEELAGLIEKAGRPPIDAMPEAQRLAWQRFVETGRFPRPGRPSKADRDTGLPRLRDLGLTKQQVWRMRSLASIPEVEFERRLVAQKRHSFEGLIGRQRPRRKAERLIDDLRRSLPWFRPEEVRQLLQMLLDRLEENKPEA